MIGRVLSIMMPTSALTTDQKNSGQQEPVFPSQGVTTERESHHQVLQIRGWYYWWVIKEEASHRGPSTQWHNYQLSHALVSGIFYFFFFSFWGTYPMGRVSVISPPHSIAVHCLFTHKPIIILVKRSINVTKKVFGKSKISYFPW